MTALAASLESVGIYWLVVWALAATAVWGAAALIATCLRRHSAQARHRVWAVSMIVVLLAPLLAPVLPVPRWWKWAGEREVARNADVAARSENGRRGGPSINADADQPPRTTIANERALVAKQPVVEEMSAATSAGTPTHLGAGRAAAENAALPTVTWPAALVAVWLTGSAGATLLFIWGLLRVRRLRGRAARVTGAAEIELCRELCRSLRINHDVELLVAPEIRVPLLAGAFYPAIILPAGYGRWSAERLRVVLTHELIHQKRHDVQWEIVAQLVKVPTWFHPLAWFAVRRLRIERELACDDAVLLAGACPADYAEQLVEVAGELIGGRPRLAPVVAIAGADPIERRNRAILDPRTWRAPLGRWRSIALSTFMASLVVIVAALSPTNGDEKAVQSKSLADTPEQASSAASDADRQIAAAMDHPTTVRLENESPEKAFLALSKTSGCPIAFDTESFMVSGAEISPTVTVRANGEPLRDILRSLGQAAIGGAKIGITVTANYGALRISAEKPTGNANRRDEPVGGEPRHVRGKVQSAGGKPAGGAAIIARVRSGVVSLHADADGRFSIPLKADDFWEFPVVVRSADDSEMAVQETHGPSTNVSLQPTKAISLIVTDGNGRPVPRAHAAIIEVQKGHSYAFQKAVFSGYTDDSGKFTVRLPERFQIGFVYAFKSGAGLDYHSYVPPDDHPDLHEKVPPQPDGLVRLSLAGSRRVTLKCIDEHGEPCAGIEVTPWILEKPGETYYLNDGRSWHVFTNDRGEAIFGWIPTWQQRRLPFTAYPADGRPADTEDAEFDPQKPSDQIIVTIHRTVELSGTVRDAGGKPVAKAEVELSGGGYENRRFSHRTESDDRGQYHFDVPPLEVYAIVARTGDRQQASPVRDGFAVYPQKSVTGIDLTLVPTTRVFGRVTFGPDNKPAVKYRVYASAQWSVRARTPDPDFPHGRRDYLDWPQLDEMAETDAQGRFELRLASGQYDFYAGQPSKNGGMIIEPDGKLHHSIKIAGEEQLEINMHCDAPPEYSVLHGTVVNGGKPVPGALVEGASQPGDGFKAVADDHGAFDIRVSNTPAVVFAKSKDGSLAGVARIGAGERNIAVPIAPTATCTVRLLHKDQQPYSSDQTVLYRVVIPIDPSNRRRGGHPASGGEVHPDRDGRLLLAGMVVGETYEVDLRDSDSRGQLSGRLTTVRPDTPGDQSLSDITFDPPPPYHPLTFEERLAKTFGRPMPAVQRNKEAKELARLADARVLVTFADPEAPLTKKLYKLLFEGDVSQAAYDNYCTMAIPVTGSKRSEPTALAKELGIELPADDSPLIVVEGTDGKVFGTLKVADLVTKEKEIDQGALLAFIKQHAPPVQDGRKLFADLLAQAKRENQRVLIQETAVWCGPCDRLATFLDQNRQLWEKDFIWVRMDIRWSGEAEIVKSLRGEARGGYPWLAILDADGKVLATSNEPDGGSNIGFPSEPDSIERFFRMFKTTSQRMTVDDLEQLKAALEKANREK